MLGKAGLERRTPLATATLLVGANLPDLDALTYAFADDATALEVRRGWTHGILAVAALPVALAGAMVFWGRFVRRRRRPEAEPARLGALLLLAFVAVLSHPLLDFLNVYGVRFLAPFSWRWFYGDALFIVDPWIWIVFALGVAFSRVRASRGMSRPQLPARIAIAAVLVYAGAMLGSSLAGRAVARRAAQEAGLAPIRVMVSPLPIDPFRRMLVVEERSGYRFGRLALLSGPTASFTPGLLPRNEADPAANAAAHTPDGRKFLVWARFPYFDVRRARGEALVSIRDARYPGPFGSWASVTVLVPDPLSNLPRVSLPKSPGSGRIPLLRSSP